MSLNDPSVVELKSKRIFLNRYGIHSREMEGKAEKELRNAYNDGGNHENGVQGMRGLGMRNDCHTGCGMTVIRCTECMEGAEWTGCEISTCHKDDRTIDLDISKKGRRIREQGEGSGSGGEVVVMGAVARHGGLETVTWSGCFGGVTG